MCFIQSGALEQDSATLLSLQSQPSQMVINEVVHSMQQGALTVFNVKPSSWCHDRFSVRHITRNKCRHHLPGWGLTNQVANFASYSSLATRSSNIDGCQDNACFRQSCKCSNIFTKLLLCIFSSSGSVRMLVWPFHFVYYLGNSLTFLGSFNRPLCLFMHKTQRCHGIFKVLLKLKLNDEGRQEATIPNILLKIRF